MIIDMSPILSGEKNIIDIDYVLEFDEGFYGLKFDKPTHVVGFVKDMAGYIRLELKATIEYTAECSRCLTPIKKYHELDFVRTVAERLSCENDDSDDYVLIEDGKLDVDLPLMEEVILDFPTKHLCSDDCKGLCPKCGVNLNEVQCDCPTKEIDPRLAVLKDLFKNK